MVPQPLATAFIIYTLIPGSTRTQISQTLSRNIVILRFTSIKPIVITHKRFILSSWEGDNAVYCGAAQRYATDSAFRTECSRYLLAYSGNESPDESISSLLKKSVFRESRCQLLQMALVSC